MRSILRIGRNRKISSLGAHATTQCKHATTQCKLPVTYHVYCTRLKKISMQKIDAIINPVVLGGPCIQTNQRGEVRRLVICLARRQDLAKKVPLAGAPAPPSPTPTPPLTLSPPRRLRASFTSQCWLGQRCARRARSVLQPAMLPAERQRYDSRSLPFQPAAPASSHSSISNISLFL